MHVLFVSPAAELGGAERCLVDAVAALRAEELVKRVTVISFADGPLVTEVSAIGANVRVLEPPAAVTQLGESADLGRFNMLSRSARMAPALLAYWLRLARTIHELAPDVVHTNGMKAHLLGGTAVSGQRGLFVHLHDFVGARRASGILVPALARLRPRARFIANSRAVAQDFERIAPGAVVRTIYNVVDTEYFVPGKTDPAWIAGLAGMPVPPADAVTFGLVATYASWKGHAAFIEAAGRLRSALPRTPLRFYVVGGPIYRTAGSQVTREELLERADRAGIAADFGLVPFQRDIAPVYRSLDAVVHASTNPEPFGRTIVEAMACGRPAVVARAGGAAELFTEGQQAFGFEPGDIADLARAMTSMLDPATRRRLGAAAREHAAAHFGRARLGPELVAVYREGLSR